MREKIRDKDRLIHIQQAIHNINKFLENKSKEDFNKDMILYHALVNNLAIIGEASYKLSKEFIDLHKEIPWKDIIHMRHFLIHGYYQVAKEIIWQTITEDILPLKLFVEECLNEM